VLIGMQSWFPALIGDTGSGDGESGAGGEPGAGGQPQGQQQDGATGAGTGDGWTPPASQAELDKLFADRARRAAEAETRKLLDTIAKLEAQTKAEAAKAAEAHSQLATAAAKAGIPADRIGGHRSWPSSTATRSGRRWARCVANTGCRGSLQRTEKTGWRSPASHRPEPCGAAARRGLLRVVRVPARKPCRGPVSPIPAPPPRDATPSLHRRSEGPPPPWPRR